jgi:hypothetical protein
VQSVICFNLLFIVGVLCPSLPDPPDNGYYSCAGNTFPYGTICQANCIDGFELSQMSFARCKSDGSWEISTTPNCKGIKRIEVESFIASYICKS